MNRIQLIPLLAFITICVTMAGCSTSSISSTPVPQATPTYDPFRETDPDTVVLAAGRPQLVEFFAYW